MSTLKVTNIKAADGTSALSIADSTGVVGANKFTDLAGTGAPDFPNGLILASNVTGGDISGVTLDDYEEGTWTPTLPNGGTLTVNYAKYIKVGEKVTVSCYVLNVAPTNNASSFHIGGLPFQNGGGLNLYHGGSFGYVGDSNLSDWLPITGSNYSHIYFHKHSSTAQQTNANYLTAASGSVDSIIVTITYFSA